MRPRDRESVRVKEIEKGYALYRVVNARGYKYSTIDDEMAGREVLSSDQGEKELVEGFQRQWDLGLLAHY